MFKQKIIQAVALLRQNPLFSSIYISVTALSVSLLMLLFILFYIRFAPVYPEENRNRTVVLKYIQTDSKDGSGYSGRYVSNYVTEKLLQGLPHLDAMAVTSTGFSIADNRVSRTLRQPPQKVSSLFVNDGFWKVFTFRFLSGKPFQQTDVSSAVPVAVISSSLSRKLFSSDESVGKEFIYNGKSFKVCGVVQDVSSVTPATFADVWLPLSFRSNPVDGYRETEKLLGDLLVYMTAPTVFEKEALKEEVREAFRRHNAQCTLYYNNIFDQPDDYWKSTFREGGNVPIDEKIRSFLLFVLALILIPSLNLSGIIASHINKRQNEWGIRKAYGASNSYLFRLLLRENLFFTALGSVIGLCLSWLLLWFSSDWILSVVGFPFQFYDQSVSFTFQMLFNPVVIFVIIVWCFMFNFLSAWLPAWWMLRKNIVDQLNRKA